MSDNILEADDLFDQAEMLDPVEEVAETASDEIGMTSQEAPDAPVEAGSDSAKKRSLLKSFSVFDGLMLISLVCIFLATVLLFLELSRFGSLADGFPWRTTEFLNQ